MQSFRGFSKWAALLVALASCDEVAPPPDAETPGCRGAGRSRCVNAVSLGGRFGCAALGDQTVWCWGRNDESQLGYESTDLCPERLSNGQTRAVACHMYPLQVVGLTGVTAVSAGGAHACAILTSGELRCWGGNTRGQLGNASALPSRTPVAVAGLSRVVSVSAGLSHTCAVVEDGQVFCWGANDRGQLGVESSPQRCGMEGSAIPCARAPVLVSSVSNIAEVVVGDAHTCVRTMAGRVQCWGTNTDGQLGAGTAAALPAPTPRSVLLGVSALRGVRALAAGGNHTCAMRDDGAVLCWGRHDQGQLGVAIPETFAPCAHACITTAVPTLGYEGASSTEDPDAGFDDPDGGDAAVAFDGSSARDAATPRDGAPMDRAASGDAPTSDARAELADLAELADIDASEDSTLPAAPTVTSVSAGGAFTCLSLSDRTVRCWGTNRSYELGNGRMNEGGAALTTVIASPGSAFTNPLQEVSTVESGGSTSCALLADHALKCWGTNETGALGVGDVSERNGPVPMTW